MKDFQFWGSPIGPMITPFHIDSIGTQVAQVGGGGGGIAVASAVWPLANLAILYPFTLVQATTLYQLGWDNGAAVSGNVDCGIYAADSDVTVPLLASTGSTAQAGTSAPQVVNIADLGIGPGQFYLALVLNNGTGAIARSTFSGTLGICRSSGMCEAPSAFPLPATLAIQAYGTAGALNYVATVGAAFRSLV